MNSVKEAVASLDGDSFDYVVVAIKALPEVYKTEDIIRDAIPSTTTADGRAPTIVLIQNGIDIEQPVAEAFPHSLVLSGVSMIGSHNYGGKIVQFEPDSLSVGYYPESAKDTLNNTEREELAREFVALYALSGADCTYHPQLQAARWRKLVYNSCINTVCALTAVDTARAYLCGLDDCLIRPAMLEILATAAAAGYPLDSDLPQKMLASDGGVYHEPSMMVDVAKGNPVELEVILGNPLRTARALGVPTPILTVVYNLLKGVQFRLMEKRGLLSVPDQAPKHGDPRTSHPSFPSELSLE